MTQAKLKQNIFLFHGDDSYTITKKIALWKEAFEKKYGPQTISVIDAESHGLTEDELLGMCKRSIVGQSLFASESFVIVKNLFSSKAYREKLGNFFLEAIPSLSASTFLLFVEQRIDKRLVLTKKFYDFEKKGILKIEDFPIPHGAMLSQWIQAEIKKFDASITSDALTYFVNRYDPPRSHYSKISDEASYDLWLLSSELHKLSLYAYGRSITRNDIDLLCPIRTQSHVFDCSAALIKRDACGTLKSALAILHANGVNADTSAALGLCSFLQNQLHDMLIIKDMLDSKNTEQNISNMLQWKPERMRIVSRQLNGVPLDFLKKVLLSLISLEQQLKSRPLQPSSVVLYTLARALS